MVQIQLFGVWHSWMEALQVHADTGNATSLNGSYTTRKILHFSSLITEISDSLAKKNLSISKACTPHLQLQETEAILLGFSRWVAIQDRFWMRPLRPVGLGSNWKLRI